MDKNTTIKVTNRESGIVCYAIPELNIRRRFAPRETKEITFGELESLTFQPGGRKILSDFLIVRNEEAATALLGRVEPEYYYTATDIKALLETGTYNEFLDCLDFAPEGVLELVKTMAVDLPLNSVSKREAILEKLDFNVTQAIEIKNSKFDDGSEDESNGKAKPVRRTAVTQASVEPTGRRAAAPKYHVISTGE